MSHKTLQIKGWIGRNVSKSFLSQTVDFSMNETAVAVRAKNSLEEHFSVGKGHLAVSALYQKTSSPKEHITKHGRSHFLSRICNFRNRQKIKAFKIFCDFSGGIHVSVSGL